MVRLSSRLLLHLASARISSLVMRSVMARRKSGCRVKLTYHAHTADLHRHARDVAFWEPCRQMPVPWFIMGPSSPRSRFLSGNFTQAGSASW